jgi:hypothetical protein
MPSIKTIAHCFFKICLDRVNDQSVGICSICGKEYNDIIGYYGNFKRHAERFQFQVFLYVQIEQE